ELAEAQKRTEETLLDLIKEHGKTREQLGGLSNTVGYILENEAMRVLPRLLLEEFGLVVKGRLVRKFVEDEEGRPLEVNIIGEAEKDGERFIVVGESKSQLSKGRIEEFIEKKLEKIRKPLGMELFPILVTHMVTSPDVVDYAISKGIKRVYYSYEF
ncbi:MAG: chordopoxvirus fusion protein, partial [Thermodesulfobacteriota bacterium]